MKKTLLTVGCLCFSLQVALAADPDSTGTPKKEEEAGKLAINGYFDTYYFTNFNRPASRDNMGQSGVGRGFDRRVDQFQLGMVQTVFKYTNKKSELVADLAFGPNAVYGNYGNVATTVGLRASYYGTPVFNDAATALIIKQAYFTFHATERLSFTAGQFGTHIGYEYIDAPLNYHYSINHTFNSGVPFYHTGLKSTLKVSDKVTAMLGVVNGFDFVHDNNRKKGIIGQLTLAPSEKFTTYINYIRTNEANTDSVGNTPKGTFEVYDVNGIFKASDKFHIGFWAMLGRQKGQVDAPGTFAVADGDVDNWNGWSGFNLYLTYFATDVFSIGLRSEYFNNKQGARGLRNVDHTGTGLGADVRTFTLTGTFKLADGHLQLKPELRADIFNKLEGNVNRESQQFMDNKGKFTKNSQVTFGMAAIYSF
jgi:Putative beta-barrel porin-2, OmpL-like. bbp2